MQKTIPIITIELTLNQFAEVGKSFPAHELPIWIVGFGAENVRVSGKTEETHVIEDMDQEISRMLFAHGERKLQEVFGSSYRDGIEVAINRVAEKEKEIDDSKNAAKSKNRTSAETRV
tara:strand:- start:326 stop:679 length:354 start_codon:yes stop_codon:yes gene_type:complete